MYDVLRDNIGLLQPINEQEEYYYEEDYKPINEGILDMFKKKPTRWQRFKNFVGRNKGKIAAGVGLGAAALGGDYALYRKQKNDTISGFKKQPAIYDVDEKNNTIKLKPEVDEKLNAQGRHIKLRYRPFGLGSEIVGYDKNGNALKKSSFSRTEAIKDMFS